MSNPPEIIYKTLPQKGVFVVNRQSDLEQIIYFTIGPTDLSFLYCDMQSSVLYVLQQKGTREELYTNSWKNPVNHMSLWL